MNGSAWGGRVAQRVRAAIASGLVCAAAVGVLGAAASPAAAAGSLSLNGVAVCSGGHAVVGIWVQSSGGGSEWARWQRSPLGANKAYYSASVNPGRVQLHVGCGGTSGTWWSNNQTADLSLTSAGTRTVNVDCADTASGTRRGACTVPPKGTARTTNPGYAGYCTWGAADEWKRVTGYYPALSGDAWNWANSARSVGFRVYDSTPAARSMVVFPKTGTNSFGHVAWVQSVQVRSDGVYITVKEMNYGAWTNAAQGKTVNFGKYTTRTVKHTSGMRYVLAT